MFVILFMQYQANFSYLKKKKNKKIINYIVLVVTVQLTSNFLCIGCLV